MNLFDLITDFLDVIILLLWKFWYVIFAFLGYLLFGKSKNQQKRNKRQVMPPVLTPTHAGGFPKPYQAGPIEQRQEEKHYTDFGEAAPTTSLDEYDSDATDPTYGEASEPNLAANELIEMERSKRAGTLPAQEPESTSVHPREDAREGMKWAMIFSPPRAKDPHMPPYLRAKRK